ncbi:MAG: AraC family transcriptional regulator, partial [Bacteroidia bacterium]
EEKFVGTEPYTQKLFALIFKQLDDPELSVEKLADMMATNRSHFQRKVKAITGLSPSEIIKTIRLEKANELLLSKNGNITEIAYQTGFSSQSYFTKCYTQHFGVSPTQMLQKHK